MTITKRSVTGSIEAGARPTNTAKESDGRNAMRARATGGTKKETTTKITRVELKKEASEV